MIVALKILWRRCIEIPVHTDPTYDISEMISGVRLNQIIEGIRIEIMRRDSQCDRNRQHVGAGNYCGIVWDKLGEEVSQLLNKTYGFGDGNNITIKRSAEDPNVIVVIPTRLKERQDILDYVEDAAFFIRERNGDDASSIEISEIVLPYGETIHAFRVKDLFCEQELLQTTDD